MAKDDFDFDFDFEKEFDLNPGAYPEDAGFDAGMEFSEEDLGLSAGKAQQASAAEDDFSLDDLSDLLGDMTEADADTPADDTFPEDDDAAAMVSRKARQREAQQDIYTPADYPEEGADAQDDLPPEEPVDPPADPEEPEIREDKGSGRKRREREAKPAKPTILNKFFDLYFAPVVNKDYLNEPQQDPANPRRRRRKSKMQIFKEVYLPPIVVCLCLILVLSFVIGFITNAIRQKQIDDSREQSQLASSQSAEELAAQATKNALEKAAAYAAGYDYANAIDTLEDYLNSVEDKAAYPEISAKRSEYVTAQSQLVEYMDPSMIPNLSFHMLMVDPARSFLDDEFGGLYNRNFISTGEFSKILDQLYANGYVLVDFDSIADRNGDQIFPKSIFLPKGKKPIMITQTMVNYWAYMEGAGFANKLVLDSNGNVKASYKDSNGTTLVGDYDLVPILESFIKNHPDFSYQGARATLAVGGKEGIFGYRINSHYVAEPGMGQSFVDSEIAGAKAIVQALKEMGYTMACYSYANKDYAKMNANQIMDDLNKWTSDITPVLGEVEIFVFPQGGDLTEYNGSSFKVMREKGFKYFVANGSTVWAEIHTEYVRQRRLMVTGNALGWKQTQFEGIFDCNSVVDMTTRVEIPN